MFSISIDNCNWAYEKQQFIVCKPSIYTSRFMFLLSLLFINRRHWNIVRMMEEGKLAGISSVACVKKINQKGRFWGNWAIWFCLFSSLPFAGKSKLQNNNPAVGRDSVLLKDTSAESFFLHWAFKPCPPVEGCFSMCWITRQNQQSELQINYTNQHTCTLKINCHRERYRFITQ